MQNLILSFKDESLDLLNKAEECLLFLEKNYLNEFSKNIDKNGQEFVNQIFRSIHTIKGNSGLFDLENIKKLSHKLENVLSKLRDSEIAITRELIDSTLLGIDRLREMIQNLDQSNEYSIDDILQNFNNLETQIFSKKQEENSKWKDLNFQKIFEKAQGKFYQKVLNTYKKLIEVNPELSRGTQDKIYFILIRIQNEENLSDFVKKLNPIQNQILHYNFIIPKIQNQNLCFLYILNANILPCEIVFQKEIDIYNKTTEKTKTTNTELTSLVNKRNQNLKEKSPIFEDTQKEESFLKVPASLVENLINLAGESIIARNEFLQKIQNVEVYKDLINIGKKISNYISLLQENLMKLRLQKLEILFERIPRIVRETAKEAQKEVDIEIDGEYIELDKTIIDAIRDPLTHIIRNAIDHGIESIEERLNKGKSPKGKIVLKAFFEGGNIIIQVSDDGKGIDLDKVLHKAIEKNIISKDQANTLTKKEILELIFIAGLSTSEKITERSGRGVGMDVVKNSIRNIKGFIDIQTEKDQGTTINLIIPQTLSIITCLLVKIYTRRYAIQENQIREIIKFNPEYLTNLHGNLVYELRGAIIPVINPYFIFKYTYNDISLDPYQFEYLIFLETEQHIFGLLTNEILNPEELMIKSLGDEFTEIPFFSGASILGDGDTIFVFDIMGIAKHFNIESNKKDIESAMEKDISRTKVQYEQYLIYESMGNYFGISIHYKPRILEILSSDIETLLGFNAFKYDNHLVPIIDIYKILNINSSLQIFDKKNIYVILIPLENSFIAFDANNIVNITNEFDAMNFEDDNPYIVGYGIYKNKTIILLNIKQIIEFWKKKNKE